MNLRNLLSLVLVWVLAQTLSARPQEYDFFWSLSDLNGGATNGDLVADSTVGQSGSIFLYYSTNGPFDSDLPLGMFFDIATSASGVIEFTAAETFDFDITSNGVDIDNRWLDEEGGGGLAGHTGTVTDNAIQEWTAFTTSGGTGILEANNGSGILLDTGYDLGADAFLFGRINFDVVGEGTIDLNIDAYSPPWCQFECERTVGAATIHATPIPEPGWTLVLMIGTTRLMSCRRRPSPC